MTQPVSSQLIFLFTDIEGSTRLWEIFPQAMSLALARHDQILRQQIENEQGRVFKTVGDAFCAVFEQPQAALKAAVKIQEVLFAEDWTTYGLPQDKPLRVRVALHSGLAEKRDDDYFGPTLNRVARLLATGYGGQILLSQTMVTCLTTQITQDLSLRDLGEHRLKDLVQPEHIYQLVVNDLPEQTFPELKSLNRWPNNLPVQLTSFVGREHEITEVKDLLKNTHLLTLMGTGGAGKTRLSLQVGAELLENYRDGVWLVELAPVVDPALLPNALAQVFGVREDSQRPIISSLIDYLRNREVLILLDNCEHLIAAAASAAESLLRSCPEVRILATSREALGIPGEVTWRIPSLSLPRNSDEVASLDAVLNYEAVRLFIDRVRAAKPSFLITPQNMDAVIQICQRLDGIPLALELAAARIRIFSVEQLAERLQDRFKLLVGGSRTALPRQQTLRALVDWSYDLLSEQERTLLQRLSVFSGGWSLEAAEAVATCASIEDWEVADLMSQLINKSLVLADEEQIGNRTETRYTMLETIRQYGLEKLQAVPNAEDEVRQAHLHFLISLAEEGNQKLRGPEQIYWGNRLDIESDNCRAALEWSHNQKDLLEPSLRLVGALGWYWYSHGYWGEGRRWFEGLLAQAASHKFSLMRAKALVGAGSSAGRQGDMTAAKAWLEEGISIFRQADQPLELAYALDSLWRALSFGYNDTSSNLLDESLAICRAENDKWLLAWTLHQQQMARMAAKDFETSFAVGQESLALFRQIGDRWNSAFVLHNLGLVRARAGFVEQGGVYWEEALEISRVAGNKETYALALNALAELKRYFGDNAASKEMYLESMNLVEQLGNKIIYSIILYNLACVYEYEGNWQLGYEYAHKSLDVASSVNDEVLIAYGLLGEVGAFLLSKQQAKIELAIQLLPAIEQVFQKYGPIIDSNDQDKFKQELSNAQAAVDSVTFMCLWAHGQALTLEQATEMGLNVSRSLAKVG